MSTAQTQEKTRAINEAWFEKLASRDPEMVKEALDAVNDFTRTTMREEGFTPHILPEIEISNDELDRQQWTDKPVKIVDKEPDSPAAVSVPFGTLPTNIWIRGQRYMVMFDRILTPRFTKDVEELRTWVMDIRQVMSDNAIKDMLAEYDGKFILACNTALVGAGSVVPTSGVAQWQNIAGGITRDTLADMLKIMPSTPSSLEVKTCLVNNITIKEFLKIRRDEAGGDLSQEIFKNGWSLQTFLGVTWIVTIKKSIVATNDVYMYADAKFLGKNYVLEPTTLYARREAFLLEFFGYRTGGMTIGHTSAVAKATFV